MRLWIAPFAVLLIGAAAHPKGPSFACKGRLSAAERTICADPELGAWDQAVAKIYAMTDRTDPERAHRQKAWLADRNRCGVQRSCLLAAYRKWPGFSEPVSGVGLSLHRQDTDPSDPADLEVMPIHGSWYYFSIAALSIRNAETGSVHEGSIAGVVDLRGGAAKFDQSPGDPYACRFRIARIGPRSWTVDQEDTGSTCAGMGVYFTGDYRAN